MDTCYPYYELYLRCFPEFPVTYRTFLQTLRPERGQIFAQWDRGALAGYALAHGSSMAMLCVEESHRRQGMGNWLMAQAEAAACRQSEPRMSLGQGAHYLFQGVPEGPAVDFFRERGYRAQWSSVNMSLSLGGFSLEKLDIPPGPEGLSYRFAEAGDREALLAAVKEAKSTWTSIFETCQDPVLLAVLEGEIAGFLILDPEGGHFSAPPPPPEGGQHRLRGGGPRPAGAGRRPADGGSRGGLAQIPGLHPGGAAVYLAGELVRQAGLFHHVSPVDGRKESLSVHL
ncbi:GNAT family N-acetyltransferase [Acutalibacter sp. 1XD8-33]|uniref:GNAT family N-acetyltransferase n=1 Tax=Acutalibacter sp. 1XD8-33 TaxID=2320081 RepID=UPI000EA2DB0B|nr:GNAT family N-acetyltransferase [Acutalibacter sp. 1XD8-33]RKJ40351.1 GNAT family N-acetyltransferase [Acutalibacter sp. 1XD8-33]